MTKHFHKLLLLLFVSLVFPGILNAQDNKPFVNPTPGEISLMAVSPFPTGINPSRQGYEEVVDCGFNLVTNMNGLEYFKQQFALMGNLDLKYLVSNTDLRNEKRSQFIKALSTNRHFGGWLFIDEPTYDALPDLAKQYDALYKADPRHFIYMNLVGQTVRKFVGPYTEYSSYLERIQTLFSPGVWSFDLYPIYKEGGKTNVMYDVLYNDLESMRTISNKTGRPFWSFCLGMGYKVGRKEFPVPTVPYLRFEAFSALAYGAQGIVYWTYGQRKSTQTETYLSALIDLKGKKTSAWYAAKQVNGEIKKFNRVFYQCKVTDVKHTGNKNFKGTRKLTGDIGFFRQVTGENSGVLVSSIENSGENYVVIVNHDVVNKQKLSLLLQTGKSAVDMTTDTRYNSGNVITLTLEPGGYYIFREEK